MRIQLFAQGSIMLVLGMFYYIFLRESGAIYGLPTSNFIGSSMPPQGQTILLSLPSFLHVIAFILMTYAITGPGKFSLLAVTAGWFAVESLFELAQYRLYARWIIEHVPGWFSGVPVLENLRMHFMFSTFDTADLAAIGVGSVLAWIWIAGYYKLWGIKS